MLLTFLTAVSVIFHMIETWSSEKGARRTRLVFAAMHILFMAIYTLGIYYRGSLKDDQGHVPRSHSIDKVLYF